MIPLSAAFSLALAVRPACATDIESAYAQQVASILPAVTYMEKRMKAEQRRLAVLPVDLHVCQELVAKQPVSYGGWELRMVTEGAAYYTHQDCDICDSLDACDLKTHQLRNLKTAHSVDCDDINHARAGKIVYSDCKVPWGERSSRAVLTCSGPKNAAITGLLDLATMTLADSRSGGAARPFDASKGRGVDERCGKLGAAPAGSVDFEVTPAHYWGQDILQLPEAAFAGPGRSAFSANLHLCAYDGDWSSFEDVELHCTLKKGD